MLISMPHRLAGCAIGHVWPVCLRAPSQEPVADVRKSSRLQFERLRSAGGRRRGTWNVDTVRPAKNS